VRRCTCIIVAVSCMLVSEWRDVLLKLLLKLFVVLVVVVVVVVAYLLSLWFFVDGHVISTIGSIL